jgi:hypothetical protein
MPKDELIPLSLLSPEKNSAKERYKCDLLQNLEFADGYMAIWLVHSCLRV